MTRSKPTINARAKQATQLRQTHTFQPIEALEPAHQLHFSTFSSTKTLSSPKTQLSFIVTPTFATLTATPAFACKCVWKDDNVPTPDQNTYNCCNKNGDMAKDGDCPIRFFNWHTWFSSHPLPPGSYSVYTLLPLLPRRPLTLPF